MAKLPEEIAYDLRFIQSHTLQPKWYKVLKVFIVVGFVAGYNALFGWVKTVVFFGCFLLLSLLVHLLYRAKTNRYTKSWLDFVVAQEGDEMRPRSIGRFYYSAIVLNAILSAAVSQLLA